MSDHGHHESGEVVEVVGGHAHTPEEIRKEMRFYWAIFFVLGCLTLVTVGVSSLHLKSHEAIALALAIASVKGFLVAAFFMHLLSEKKLVLIVLAITVIFFAMLLWGPWQHHYSRFGV